MANTWAMPLPIVPAPMTPIFRMSMSALLARGLQPLDRQRHRVPAAEAEPPDARLPARVLERGEQRAQHARAGRADRVAERRRAAPDVRPRGVEAELAADGDRRRRERLVDLVEVEALRGRARLLPQL